MAVKYSKKGGTNPLGYMGVSSIAAPYFIVVDRPPHEDYLISYPDINFFIGTLWLDTSTDDMWILASRIADVPNWVRLNEVLLSVIQINADVGIAYPTLLDGEITVSGGTNISTSGIGNTLSITLDNGTDGQLLISGGTGPVWASIPSTPTITVTNGTNSINLESTVTKAFDTLSDGIGGTATPVAGKINILGDGTNIFTSATGDTVTVTLSDNPTISGTFTLSLLNSVGAMYVSAASNLFATAAGLDGQVLIGGGVEPTWANITGTTIVVTDGPNSINLETSSAPGLDQLTSDSGVATPSSGQIDIYGDIFSISTTAGSETLIIDLEDHPTIAGTLTMSALSSAGVMMTNGTGVVTTSAGNDGQVLIGGGTAPTWASITEGNNITVTPGANTLDISTTTSFPSGSQSFMAYQPSYYDVGKNITYYLGDEVVLTENFDSGSNFYPGDGAGVGNNAYYTAPVDGTYYFQFNFISIYFIYVPPPPPGPRDPLIKTTIHTTSNNFVHKSYNIMSQDNLAKAYSAVTVPLVAGDTVSFSCVVDYEHCNVRGHATNAYTYVAGYLVLAD